MIATRLINTLVMLSRFGGDVDVTIERLDPEVAGLAAQIAAAVPGAWASFGEDVDAAGYLRLEVAVWGGKTVAAMLHGIEEPPGWQPVPDDQLDRLWLEAGQCLARLATEEISAGVRAAAASTGAAAAGRN